MMGIWKGDIFACTPLQEQEGGNEQSGEVKRDTFWAPSAGTTARIPLTYTEAKWGQAQGYSRVPSMVVSDALDHAYLSVVSLQLKLTSPNPPAARQQNSNK